MAQIREPEDLGLLATALGSASAAARILETFGDLTRTERAGAAAIAQAGQIPQKRAERLIAAFVLGRRAALAAWPQTSPFRHARDVALSYGPLLAGLDHEVFLSISLDAKHRRLHDATIARGSVTECLVSTREAFVDALRFGAAAVLFVHNHPSGAPEPSPEDRLLTAKLVSAGNILDIPVVDHVILGREGFYSFAEEGLI